MWKTFEYLFYLAIFILYFKLSETASIDTPLPDTLTSPVIPQLSTTTERSITDGVNTSSGGASKLKRTLEECGSSFSWLCLKLEFVTFLEHLTEQEELRLLNGISVVKDPEAKEIKTSELMAGK